MKKYAKLILYGYVVWQFGVLAFKTVWESLLLQPDNIVLTRTIMVAIFPLAYWWVWKLMREDEAMKEKTGKTE